MEVIAFGPVPSRRLGRSLGINNIPPKVCDYSCVYCQLGRTTSMESSRRAFYDPRDLVKQVKDKVENAKRAGHAIDYLTFVPDGEPTLDINLGSAIALLRPLGIRIAVITNGALLSEDGVRQELQGADWVSIKVDSVRNQIWRTIDRPHGRLQLDRVLEGALEFSQTYAGSLVTETMLVKGINDGDEQLAEVAEFVARLRPVVAYIAVPTRPPAEGWVCAPPEDAVSRAYRAFRDRVGQVECLIGHDGTEFACTGDIEKDILGITSVHPMHADAVRALLANAGADWSVIIGLVSQGQLVEVEYRGEQFYTRRLPSARRQ